MKTLIQQLQKRLNTIEDAFKETGRAKVDFSVYPEDLRVNREAEYNAIVIVEAARKIEKEIDPEEIDWSNRNQRKWIPWFSLSPSSFAFDGSGCDYGNAFAGSGSRLRVLNEETADHIGEKFPDVFEKVQLK